MKYNVGDKVRIIDRQTASYMFGFELEITERWFPLIRQMYGKEFEIMEILDEKYVLYPSNPQNLDLHEVDLLKRMSFNEDCFVPHDSFTYNLLFGGDM